MQNRYRLYRRNKKIFYIKDRITGKVESLDTSSLIEAQILLVARNQAIEQPLLCREFICRDDHRSLENIHGLT